MTGKTVLVVGASGLVGSAAVDAFLDADWEVVAFSRRRPEVFSERSFSHHALDLRDPAACAALLAQMGALASRITHVVYTAVHELPGLVAGWQDPQQMQTNLAMLRNLLEPLLAAARLEHVTLLQGTKAYGVHLHPIPVPARERLPRDPHPNFYWLQEDYVRERSAAAGFGWTILRPTVVLGPNVGVVMNVLPVVGLYAALCREEGTPFGYPGHVAYVREAVDARLIARAAEWAARTPAAWGEHYNLTNGEAFSWRDLWPAMADCLGVAAAPDHPVSMAQHLPARAATWDRIVRRHGLRPTTMTQLLGESHHYADFHFGWGLTQLPPPAFVSTVKVKQAGFTESFDTELAVRHWLKVLMDRRILPEAEGLLMTRDVPLTLVAHGLRFPEGPIAMPDGSLLVVEIAGGALTRITPRSGEDALVTVVAELGGGPNGAAIGPDGRCYVCNNGGFEWWSRDGVTVPKGSAPDYRGGSIQAVDLATGRVQMLYERCGGQPLNGPNDIAFDAHGGFWFTDHGHTHARTRDRGVIYYARADGSEIREAVFPVESPNGIALSPDGRTLYAAETFTARLWAWDLEGPGRIARGPRTMLGGNGRLVYGMGGYHLFDSMAVDAEGNVHVASIPAGVSTISPDGRLLEQVAMPERFATNVCFGGPDLRTAYVTLSSTGRLMSYPSRRPGASLPF